MATPMHEFAGGATAEQRAILMLMERVAALEDRMERVAALEDRMLAVQAKAARLESWQLAGGGVAFTVGKRALWSCRLPTPSIQGNMLALTDLGSDLVERALARRSGPLYEHITHGEYDRSDRREPLTSFVKGRLNSYGVHKKVVFLNDVDVGMIVVFGHIGSLFDMFKALHEIFEEDDGDLGPPRCLHSILFNRLSDSALACVDGLTTGTVPAPAPGGMEAALERYITEHEVTDRRLAQGIRDTFVRTWSAQEANGSTKWGVSNL